MEPLNNPFSGYILKYKEKNGNKKLNPVHEIVNTYFQMIGKEFESKMFYQGRYGYGKLASEAKKLLTACGEDLEDALWALDQMKHKADKGKFDWSIATCLKHNLRWGK